MEVYRGLEAVPASGKRAVAIGAFDGVHRGHRRIISELVAAGRARDLESAVITFDPHPLSVLAPESAPAILTPLDQKAELIAELGVDALLVLPFNSQFARLAPEDFARDVLVEGIGVSLVLVGFNFTFGHHGIGVPEDLVALGRRLGFETRVFERITVDGITVSSTAIRGYLARGEVARAGRLLGRPYSIRGEVVPGDRRGRQIGYPTANLRWPAGQALPGRGVYAVAVSSGAHHFAGVANVGRRPTFGGHGLTLETHLIDFSGDLYGQALEVSFLARIREERTFANPAELARQIADDAAAARRIYNSGQMC